MGKGRETADIVFCLDASGSMYTAINGVKDNIVKLIESLKTNLQQKWDVRFDFLAYSNDEDNNLMRLETVNCKGKNVVDSLYGNMVDPNGGAISSLFVSDVNDFKRRLQEVEVCGDEGSALALDMCADFPFRDASTCHRVVIFLTDETCKTGVYVNASKKKILDLAKKYQERKIALYMTTPNCDVWDTLSQIDKAEWTIDESNGLENVNFTKLMESIGKSVSMSQNALSSVASKPSPMFNEDNWTSSREDGWVKVS